MNTYRIYNSDRTVDRLFTGTLEEAAKLADQMGRVFEVPFVYKLDSDVAREYKIIKDRI